ncbi:putative deoxyribonuclease RhsC [compost metagenome]
MALIQTPTAGVPELAYIQSGHLGTPRVVIDPVRDVAIWEWSNKSEVFGDQAPANDPDGDGVAFDLALRFPGQQATDASGLFYNYQREYEPALGRYSQSDPIGLKGGISTFTYVENNPQSAVDPEGLEGIGPWNNGEMNNVTGYVPANDCEREAVADLLIDLVPVTSMASFAMDSMGVDINFYENPGVHFGEYGTKTPYAAAGHMLDAAASRQDGKAAKRMSGAAERGIHYSVANGRRNRAAVHAGNANLLRGGSKILGPLGAMLNYRSNYNKCQCPAN